MHRQQILGSGIILGTILVLSLVAAGVIQNRASAQGSGIGLLWTDVALLVVYAFAGMILWKQTFPSATTAAMVGAQIGLAVGAVQIANHLIDVSGGIGRVHYGGPVCTRPPGLGGGDGGQVYPEGSEPAWESGDRAFEIE